MPEIDGKPIHVLVECYDCEATATVEWPEDEYASTLSDEVTLDGQVELPEGWWAQPGALGGDNILRCPAHARNG